MKKTLIALAVLAASGASFAQVTITGEFATGYRATSTGGAALRDTAGLGVETSQINFSATEDLGGGWKATANMALAGADRSGESGGGAVAGRDATMSIATPNGTLLLGTYSSADYLSGGLANVGSYRAGWDGKLFNPRTTRDVIAYTFPKFGDFSLQATYQEQAGALASQGLGQGTTGDATNAAGQTGQSLTGLVGNYASGPLNANLTYLQFASPTGTAAGTNKNQTRLSANYDFGVAKLGGGVVVTNMETIAANGVSPRVTDSHVAVAVPFGKATFGLSWAQRRYDDIVAGMTAATNNVAAGGVAAGQVNGTSLQGTYALSKRTAVIGNWARWDGAPSVRESSSQFNLLVSHSF